MTDKEGGSVSSLIKYALLIIIFFIFGVEFFFYYLFSSLVDRI